MPTAWADLRPARPRQCPRHKVHRGLLVRAILFHRSRRGWACRQQRPQWRGGSNLAQITVWKVQTSPTVAFVQEGAALPVASGQDGGTFTTVSSNGTTSWNSHHMGGRAAARLKSCRDQSLCLRGDAFEWNAPVAVFLAGRIMGQHRRRRQYRAGRGEWTGLCGEQSAADDFRPRRASVCRAARPPRPSRRPSIPISLLMKSPGFSNMSTDRCSRSELAPVKSRKSTIRKLS